MRAVEPASAVEAERASAPITVTVGYTGGPQMFTVPSDLSATGSLTMAAQYLGDIGHRRSSTTALAVRAATATALNSSANPALAGKGRHVHRDGHRAYRTPSGRGTTTLRAAAPDRDALDHRRVRG